MRCACATFDAPCDLCVERRRRAPPVGVAGEVGTLRESPEGKAARRARQAAYYEAVFGRPMPEPVGEARTGGVVARYPATIYAAALRPAPFTLIARAAFALAAGASIRTVLDGLPPAIASLFARALASEIGNAP